MSNKVFYSWQSDSPARTNRNFIESALKTAIKELGKSEGEFQKAEREIGLDKDTKGVSGSPSVVDTIFEKIRQCGVFVADLTYVGKTDEGRLIANPNVLIEYGWALSHIGSKRIICVMNTYFGEPSKDSLPFDIVYKRWPYGYCLASTDSGPSRKTVEAELANFLKLAILSALPSVPSDEPPEFELLHPGTRKTCFLDDRGFAGKHLPFGDPKGAQDIYWLGGKQRSLRIFPQHPSSKLRRSELEKISKKQPLGFLDSSVSGSWDMINESGYLVFEAEGAQSKNQARNITQLTQWGELWSIDAAVLSRTGSTIPFPEISLSHALAKFLRFMSTQLKLKGEVTLEAGYSGILGMSSSLPPLADGMCWKSFDKTCGSAVEDEFVTTMDGISLTPSNDGELVVSYDEFDFPRFREDQEDEEKYFIHAYKSLLPFFEDYWDTLGVERFPLLPTLK